MMKFSSLQQVLRDCESICLGIRGCQLETGDRSVCLNQIRMLVFVAGGMNLKSECDFKDSGLQLHEFPFTFLCIHIIDWQVIFWPSLQGYSTYDCVGKVVWVFVQMTRGNFDQKLIFHCRKWFSSLCKCWYFRLNSLNTVSSAVCVA